MVEPGQRVQQNPVPFDRGELARGQEDGGGRGQGQSLSKFPPRTSRTKPVGVDAVVHDAHALLGVHPRPPAEKVLYEHGRGYRVGHIARVLGPNLEPVGNVSRTADPLNYGNTPEPGGRTRGSIVLRNIGEGDIGVRIGELTI